MYQMKYKQIFGREDDPKDILYEYFTSILEQMHFQGKGQ